MEKLVIEITAGDEYTWHCTVTKALSYQSKELFLSDLEDYILKRIVKEEQYRDAQENLRAVGTDWIKKQLDLDYKFSDIKENKFVLNNVKLDYDDFVENLQYKRPEVYSLSEWFDKNDMSN